MEQLISLLPIVGIAALMYFMMIRPERKRKKEEQKLCENTQIGDEILTIGGLYGRIVSIKDDSFVIETFDHSKIRIAKSAMQTNFTVHE